MISASNTGGREKRVGKVIFAGAGPGDPELLTLKTLRYLLKADVILTDRLVSDKILKEFTRKDALIIPVGKQRSKDASMPQQVINDLLVTYAQQGCLVVRLKGGDVSIFSNILDELQTLVSRKIPYEIVPGVTAALGAAATAGIPLTARGYSTSVRFLTCYRPDNLDAAYWKELASSPDTLVFYMSSDPLDTMVQKLLEHGIAQDRWLAVIEQATTPKQNVYSYPIHEYLRSAAGNIYVSPALVIIGKVAALARAFRWQSDSEDKSSYFKPLETTSVLKNILC